MASEQLRREDHADETVVEKDRVPKMTTHFESLTVTGKAREDHQLHHVPLHGEQGRERMEEISKEENHVGEGRQGSSLEELSDMRVTAKQNSMAAVEERYEKAKEICVSKGQSAAQYAAERAKSAAEYVSEKAVVAKDVAVESGKGAAGYVGKVAAGVRDQAVEAGRETAYYTRVAVADATKAMGDVTSTVGEKAAVVKDRVADAGKTVVGYAGEKIAAAKDAVVAGNEGETEPEKGRILKAIGETIVEMGQTTKDILAGFGENPNQVDKDRYTEE